jgi:hypothetical protein
VCGNACLFGIGSDDRIIQEIVWITDGFVGFQGGSMRLDDLADGRHVAVCDGDCYGSRGTIV